MDDVLRLDLDEMETVNRRQVTERDAKLATIAVSSTSYDIFEDPDTYGTFKVQNENEK